MQQWQYWDEISLFIFLMIFPYFFSIFMNIHKYEKYANMMTCIYDHEMKGLCLSFNLVQRTSNGFVLQCDYFYRKNRLQTNPAKV